jgi:tRNA (uracil-5-)-methyltransferase TRM9
VTGLEVVERRVMTSSGLNGVVMAEVSAPSFASSDGKTLDSQETGASEAYEAHHVHTVYNAIAPHFAATRHTPWPLVVKFIRSQPAGSVGIDVGCGSGRYMGVRDDILLLGCDRSEELVKLARQGQIGKGLRRKDRKAEGANSTMEGRAGLQEPESMIALGDAGRKETLVADSLSLPFRSSHVDFAICIAVLHHLSTRERRREGIRQILQCLRPPPARRKASDAIVAETSPNSGAGEALLYVWALEQAGSRRGWEEGGEQDLLVPWVIKSSHKGQQSPSNTPAKKDSQSPGSASGKSAGNDDSDNIRSEVKGDEIFQRYYHLYRKGELEEDVLAAGGMVQSSGYERDNWWVVATRREEGDSDMDPDRR